jgi:FkbM family methyltransferase
MKYLHISIIWKYLNIFLIQYGVANTSCFWNFQTNRTIVPHSFTILRELKHEKFRSFSAAKQDLMAYIMFNDKSKGYFVDLGTSDYNNSNTYGLEVFNGWKGICIEPNPVHYHGILQNRLCSLYVNPVSNTSGTLRRFRFGSWGWTGNGGLVGEEFDNKGEEDRDAFLVTVTLTDILHHEKAPKVIDYFSLDVEGAEENVLSGIDFATYTFLMITIERPSKHCHDILTKFDYHFIYQMAEFGECLYLHKSLPKFNELRVQYHQKTIPRWDDENRPYLLKRKISI